MITTIIWLHLVATLYLLGLICCIQIVHYPLMNRVDGDRFVEFHGQHGVRISVVVVAPMVIELVSAAVLAVWIPDGVEPALPMVGLILVVAIWLSTFAIQVPLHRQLSAGFDEVAHRRLVRSNWLRTVAWSTRAVLAVLIAIRFTAN